MASWKVSRRTVPCVGVVEWSCSDVWSCSDSGLQSGWPGTGPGVPISISVNVVVGNPLVGSRDDYE